MQPRNITFYEYRGYIGTHGVLSTRKADLGLTEHQLRLLSAASKTIVPGKRIFDISESDIQARSFVGVIRIPGAQIEILPKLLAGGPNNSNPEDDYLLRNLMFMLSYTNVLDSSDTGLSNMSGDFGTFIEIYITIFANRLSQYLLRRGIPRQYVDREENLRNIRGCINFAKHSRANFIDQSRVYCQFSEFSENNTISKALKYTAVSLLRLTTRSSTQLSLHRCIGLLDGVIPEFISPDVLERSVHERRDSNFNALLSLTKFFLKKLRPDFGSTTSTEVFGIVFDMNELFEEFVYQVLRKNAQDLGIDVKSQKKRRLVSFEKDIGKDWQPRSLFDTYTDIHITFPGTPLPDLIVDTKYKFVGEGNHYGVANPDVYQVLAYRQIYSSPQQIPNVALIYPEADMAVHKAFRVSESDSVFYVRTLNLSRDLRSNIVDLVNDLKHLVQTCRDAG